jgi:hypothetical protein
MLTYHIQVQGLSELNQSFQRAPELTQARVTVAMNKSLVRLQATAKSLAPVDQGILRGSLLISPTIWNGSTATGSVGTNLAYSIYQEQGTGIYGPHGTPIRPKTKKVMAWNKNGTWHFAREVKGVRPKWYMRTSAEQNQSVINGYFNTAMDEVARALAGGAA